VGEGLDLAGVGVLGGVDLAYPLLHGGGFGVALAGGAGGLGREGGGEQCGAVGAEDPGVEEFR